MDVASGGQRFYLFDPQGSVAHVLNGSGAVIDSRMYDAYGGEAVRDAGNVAIVGDDSYGFNARWGYVADRELGPSSVSMGRSVYYCQNRYYSSSWGRWLERDPIGFAGGMNPYSYCAGQPVGTMDPDGLRLRISDGYTPEERKQIEEYLDRLKNADRTTRNMMYQLINDDVDHVIAPTRDDPVYGKNKRRGPHTDSASDGTKTVTWFDPNISSRGRRRGPGGSDAPATPDVILDHELGHAYGRPDPVDINGEPKSGAVVRPGDVVNDIENPYRRWKFMTPRVRY